MISPDTFFLSKGLLSCKSHRSIQRELRSDCVEPVRKHVIAFVVDRFDLGGAEKCIANTINELDPDRFVPILICLKSNGLAMKWITRECRVIEIGKQDGNDFAAIGRLSKALKACSVDLVQSHNWGTLVECTLAQKLARTKHHVFVEHGAIFYNQELRPIKRFVRGVAQRMAMRSCSVTVSIAERTKAMLCNETRFPARRIHVLDNGISQPTVSSRSIGETREITRARIGCDSDEVLIGTVGRLVGVKGIDVALRAVSKIDPGVRWRFLVVGGGPEQEHLEQLAAELQLASRVNFVGAQECVGDWYSAMDLFVNSSHSEGMCLAILEAMSFSLPIVATDAGDNRRLVNGSECCGTIVPTGDADALASGLEELISDPGRRGKYSLSSRRVYETSHTVEAMVDRYESVYLDLLEPGKRTQGVDMGYSVVPPSDPKRLQGKSP